MLDIIFSHNWLFITLIALLGLLVGNFLNVVVHRLPIMSKIHYYQQLAEIFKQPVEKKIYFGSYNLAVPNSHCPNCQNILSIWHNIPVISYLLLRCRCAHCNENIPIRYLLIEILSSGLAVIAAFQFGPSLSLFAVLLFTWILLAISFIDIETQLIPDLLSLLLLWIGLLLSCVNLFTTPNDAIIGAALAYMFFYLIDKIFYLCTKKQGLGRGDFKLLAAVGAWTGWQLLPLVVFMSSIFGIIFSILMMISRRPLKRIPFAPFIAFAAWIAIIWGFDLTQYYLQFLGVNFPNVF